MSEFALNAGRMWGFLRDGGFTMWLLVGSMLVLWAALGYRIALLRRGSDKSLRILLEEIKTGGWPQNKTGIVTSAIVLAVQIEQHYATSIVREIIELRFFQEFESVMGRFGVVIRSIVVVAPLLGLLGTVSGMMETFRSLDGDGFYAQSGGIAAGIAEALVATQLGLAVAIPGLLIGRTLQRREERLRNELVQIREMICAALDSQSGTMSESVRGAV